jgi:hypothetical protein
VTKKLKAHFARYGIPETVVTDNGAQFISNDFNTFSTKYEFKHVRSSPHHHKSNGMAESAVKQAKKMMKKCKESGDDPYLALLTIRNTPQQHHVTSPVQRLLNRRTRTRLPSHAKLLKPKLNKRTAQNIKKAKEIQKKYYDQRSKQLEPLEKGDIVRMQPIKLCKKWKKGRVVQKVGIRAYEVECQGYKYIRNRKFLRREVPTGTNGDESNSHEDDPPALPEEQQNGDTGATTNINTEEPIDVPEQTSQNETAENPQQSRKTRSGRNILKPARLGFETEG